MKRANPALNVGFGAVLIASIVFLFTFLSTALAFDDPGSIPALAEARHELFAARYEKAATLYSGLLEQHPAETDAWYGLVRAQLRLHHSREAYAAADMALSKAPESAGAQTAAGLAMYRRGELSKAEAYFRAALKIKPNHPGALRGMASISSTVSMFKTARALSLKAYSQEPDDTDLMIAHANTLNGEEHIAGLEAALAVFDPESEEARSLRFHIANDRAVGGRKLRRLVSPYESTRVRLFRIMDGPSQQRGVGISLRLNGSHTVRLLLDTGASGISLSPKSAEKAGLKPISSETSEAKGIGDRKAEGAESYLAAEVRAGDVIFADYPVSIFASAKSSDYDGLIGADVFRPFLVKIDFVQMVMSLEARPEGIADTSDEPIDWNGPPAPGFYRAFRFGDHLAVLTFINHGRSALFLIDSGSSANLIDTETAREFTTLSADSRTTVGGIQGKVDQVSRANRISLVFAGLRQDNPDIIAISLEKMGDSMGVGFGGILGMPVLARLAVTIDYRNGTVKFEHNMP